MDVNKELLLKFGESVKKRRKELNLSQEDLGFEADLHRTYIGMIERGEKNITLISMGKIAKALKTTISKLMVFDHGE